MTFYLDHMLPDGGYSWLIPLALFVGTFSIIFLGSDGLIVIIKGIAFFGIELSGLFQSFDQKFIEGKVDIEIMYNSAFAREGL